MWASPTPKPVVLLSFFDGIGTAAHIVENLCGQPRLAYAWEIDDDCIKVTRQHFPWLQHRGALEDDDFRAVAQDIEAADPHGECRILFTGGPPCHDFSVVKGLKDGRSGAEGSKFTLLCDKADQLEGLLPNHHFDFIIENVLMNDPGDLQYFNERLRAQPIVLDSADLGIVNRPRLWWSRLDWGQLRSHPVTGEDLQWSQVQGNRKLHLGMPLQDPASIYVMANLDLTKRWCLGRSGSPASLRHLLMPRAVTPRSGNVARLPRLLVRDGWLTVGAMHRGNMRNGLWLWVPMVMSTWRHPWKRGCTTILPSGQQPLECTLGHDIACWPIAGTSWLQHWCFCWCCARMAL